MKFSDKVSKILKFNTLGINSPSGLEEFIGAGKGAITTPLKEDESPGLKTQKKIVEKLRINQQWWDIGEGEIFEGKIMENSSASLHEILLESIKGINKLLDQNKVLIDASKKEVERLDKDKNWAFTELEKLHVKLTISKESQ